MLYYYCFTSSMDYSPSSLTNIFTDSVTKLPHYMMVLPDLERRLKENASLGLLVVNIYGLDPIEESNGPEAYDLVVSKISALLSDTQGTIIRKDDILVTCDIGASSFMIFLSERRKEKNNDCLQKEDVERIADRIHEQLYPQLCGIFSQFTREQPKLAVGYSLIVHNPLIRSRRLIYKLVEEAKEMTRLQRPITKAKAKERLQRLILKEEISTVFQPIYNLKDEKIMGYEALTRGPRGTALESPLNLFSTAREVGLIYELDRLCRRKALTASKSIPSNAKIFINTLPNTMYDPEFRGTYLESFLKGIRKTPDNIVFEINERIAIDSFSSFREAIRYYTDLGMSIAIDDTGTGYSTLEAIVELKPKYLKFDISMVRGIAQDVLKQEMLKMLCILASNINSQIIAEGIETAEELQMLQSLGLEIGQGYYYSKPLDIDQILRRIPPLKVHVSV